jgi:hypothetical protein
MANGGRGGDAAGNDAAGKADGLVPCRKHRISG